MPYEEPQKTVGRDYLVYAARRSPFVRDALERAVRDHGPGIVDAFRTSLHKRLTNTQHVAYANAAPDDCYTGADELTSGVDTMSSENPLVVPTGSTLASRAGVPTAYVDAVDGFASKWRAESTLDGYLHTWLRVADRCAAVGEHALPMRSGVAIGVVADFARSGVAFSTVRNMVAAIRFVHKNLELPDPTRNAAFDRLWSGIMRDLGTRPTRARIALTRLEVGKMITAAVEDGDHAAAAALAIGYEGALRASDLRTLRVEWTRVRNGKCYLFLDRSKSDQTREGAEVVITTRSGAPFDAVVIAEAWLRRVGRRSGPLFARCDLDGGDDVTAISKRTILRIVKRFVARAALPDVPLERVGSHSLRAGWATEEILLGTAVPVVADHLRHSDLSTIMKYFEPRQRYDLTCVASAGRFVR